jgi:hypothetical protein
MRVIAQGDPPAARMVLIQLLTDAGQFESAISTIPSAKLDPLQNAPKKFHYIEC